MKRFLALLAAFVLLSVPSSAGVNWPPSPIQIVVLTATNDTTAIIPPSYRITNVTIRNTTANAVTGGIKIGTTSGATDVVLALAVGASAIVTVPDATLLIKAFSASASQTLFIQDVTAWNSASLNITISIEPFS